MIAGVAGGLAELWDVDPSLVRVAWAVLVFLTGGIALLVYIIIAIVVPEEDEVPVTWPAPPAPPPASPTPPGTPAATPAGTGADVGAAPPPGYQPYGAGATRQDARSARREARAARRAARGERNGMPASAIGGVILVVLGVFFLAREWLPALDFDWVWPLILVGIGVVLLVSALAGRPDDRSGPP
jgi:phage shock protein C